MRIPYVLSHLVIFLLPLSLALAAPSDLSELLDIFSEIIDILIPMIFGLTFLTIAWGVIRGWIMGDASTEDIDKGKKIALVGVIALVIMSSIWGILNLLRSSLFD